jgi:hypothetical protein
MGTSTEFRCPRDPAWLFMKYLSLSPPRHTDGNLMEFSCPSCKRNLRRAGNDVAYVLHRYDVTGALVETVEVQRLER